MTETRYLMLDRDHVARSNRYYDVVTGLYLQFYGEYFHMCFQKPGESRDEAMQRMNTMILEDARLGPESRMVDLGGGVGALCRLAVQHYGCSATCVNINELQLSIGRKRAKQAGVDVQFVKQDITTLTLDAPHSAALLLGVDCYIPDKRRMLKRIAANLESGGRLVIAAWMQREDPSPLEKAFFIPEYKRCLGISDSATFSRYQKLFDDLGFRIVKFEDRTADISHYLEMLYREQLETARSGLSVEGMVRQIANPALLKALARGELRAAVDDGFRGVLYLKLCHDAGVFKYGYFVVEAP